MAARRTSKHNRSSPGSGMFKKGCFWLVAAHCFCFILYLDPGSWILGRQGKDWKEFSKYYLDTFNREPTKGLNSWLTYAQQQKCGTRGQHYEDLDQDLEFFREQIRLNHGRPLDLEQVIPRGKNITDLYLAYSLENHKLTIAEIGSKGAELSPALWDSTKSIFKDLLEPVRKHKPPIRTKFIINLHDRALEASAYATYPVLSYCKQDYYTNDQPVPPGIINNSLVVHNHRVMNTGPKHHNFVASPDLLIPARSSLQPERLDFWFWPFYSRGLSFRSRQDVINWRGSTTGEWGDGPRFHLVGKFGGTDVHPLSHDSQVQADFAFTQTVQKPDGIESPTERYRFAKHMKYSDLQEAKYILDVDGNGFTGRFPGLLRSGSLIFKSSRYREWFTGVLEPFKHYIPVNYDLSNLAEKVDWVHRHPDVAERVVEESRKKAETSLGRKDIMCYFYRFMLEYQTLFDE